MAKPSTDAPPHKVALYEKVVATNPRVQRKGATMPYTSLNGNTFSLLNKDGVLLRRELCVRHVVTAEADDEEEGGARSAGSEEVGQEGTEAVLIRSA